MTAKFKVLAHAFAALATMSLGAAAAQATEFHATTPNTAAVFSQQIEPHQIAIGTGPLSCPQAQLEGLATNSGSSQTQTTFKELTATATYTACTLGGAAGTFDMNGCKFTITNSLTEHTIPKTAYLDITGCTAGKAIQLTTIACALTVPEQHNLSHIVFTNTGTAPNHDVHAQFTITGIKYQAHGALCPGVGGEPTKSFTDGQLTGKTTLTAREYTGSEPTAHLGHQYERLRQTGTQVGILAT